LAKACSLSAQPWTGFCQLESHVVTFPRRQNPSQSQQNNARFFLTLNKYLPAGLMAPFLIADKPVQSQ